MAPPLDYGKLPQTLTPAPPKRDCGLTLTLTIKLRLSVRAATAALRVQLLEAAEAGDLRLFKSTCARALRCSLLLISPLACAFELDLTLISGVRSVW
jgi:hypothetical protein